MVRNSRENFLCRAQEWDYFHGIAAVKRMQGMYHGTLVAQGAFSIYRRAALLEVGGWPESVGEDIVLSWALLNRNYRIGYADDALAFTNVPNTIRQFALQRKRWPRGLMEAFKVHWQLLFRRRMSTLFVWWKSLLESGDFEGAAHQLVAQPFVLSLGADGKRAQATISCPVLGHRVTMSGETAASAILGAWANCLLALRTATGTELPHQRSA